MDRTGLAASLEFAGSFEASACHLRHGLLPLRWRYREPVARQTEELWPLESCPQEVSCKTMVAGTSTWIGPARFVSFSHPRGSAVRPGGRRMFERENGT